MGLDSVELIMAFEEEFDIQISDEEASRLLTPRQVAEFVAKKLNIPIINHEKYLFHKKFNVFRRFLMHEFGIERQKIKPNALMTDLLQNNLPKKWTKISNFVAGGKLASLEILATTNHKIHRCYVAFILIIIAIFLYPYNNPVRMPFVALTTTMIFILPSLIFFLFNDQIKKSFATEIPEHLNTVGKVTAYISLSKNEDNALINNELNFDNILQRVIKITQEQLQIPIDKIKPDSHFIDDLDMDR